ncbi:hypothetical protein GPECTOR_37g156 [Gonium pectorale]|uniref:Uncharacterized protein n=1 Tax=Gonium pectorale TaxID=33097 RepID=A0A150GCT4_GONPE|nr:hypothetical protein GPECTOR_37g156 [Gonium pectorale]|eukprot:KXZ47150.1 hypothetical protein GPECTOR_37g156 [Gonium pectorale]
MDGSQTRRRFCSAVPFALPSQSDGVCDDCWRCCMHPERYGMPGLNNSYGTVIIAGCAKRCGCNRGSPCDFNEECGPGLFCMRPAQGGMKPSCQPCLLCDTDEAAAGEGEGCFPQCPAGPLDGLLLRGLAASGSGDPTVPPTDDPNISISATDLAAALSPLAETLVNLTFALRPPRTERGGDSIIIPGVDASNVTLAVTAALARGSRTVLCPTLDVRDISAQEVALAQEQPGRRLATLPGCPCAFADGAVLNVCPAGYICSRKAFTGLPSDDPTAVQLRAVCVPCLPGQYCPQGSTEAAVTNDMALDCPAGYYCPTPAERHLCPAGAFCVARAISPTNCTYSDIGSWIAITSADRETSVLRQIRDGRGPRRGNFCPNGSTTFEGNCPGGMFCPNSSINISCPAGHYCKPQSTYPVKCPA